MIITIYKMEKKLVGLIADKTLKKKKDKTLKKRLVNLKTSNIIETIHNEAQRTKK